LVSAGRILQNPSSGGSYPAGFSLPLRGFLLSVKGFGFPQRGFSLSVKGLGFKQEEAGHFLREFFSQQKGFSFLSKDFDFHRQRFLKTTINGARTTTYGID
jgi:hypothetical protein